MKEEQFENQLSKRMVQKSSCLKQKGNNKRKNLGTSGKEKNMTSKKIS